MKIYTYYQDINFPEQNELINLWKISWSRHGYQPIALNLEDAKKHPYFATLNSEMRRIFNEITSKQITEYGMSCWFRWLAYATQAEEKFYVSDYDAINLNFLVAEPSNQLHLMDQACPFLASGTPKQFENLCKAFVEVSNERIEILKEKTNHYHDQEFFYYNFTPLHNDNHEYFKNKYEIHMTSDRTKIGGQYNLQDKNIIMEERLGCTDIASYGVAHIAHSNVKMIQKNTDVYKNLDREELRVQIIKEILDNTHEINS